MNEATKRLNAVWVTFILLLTYLFIATGKITHKDLFLETPVKLPILNVDVPLLGYFIAAPVFVLAVHFYFLIQLRGLAAKFGEYDAVLSNLPDTEHGQVERLRHRIDNSLFAQILGGPPSAASFFLRSVAVLTVVILPIMLLLSIQLTFLAYQNVIITNIHRGLIFVDVVMLVFYFGTSAGLFKGASGVLLGRKSAVMVRRLGGEFLAVWHWGEDVLLVLSVAFVAGASILGSWFVAVLPSEPSYYPEPTRAWLQADADPVHQGPSSWFSNRLVLPDQNLIEGFDLEKAKVTRSLRGRHFVSAIFDRTDLRRADFTGADLSFASFQGAKLEKAQFDCAYSDSGGFSCTQLQEARFDQAEMLDASLWGAKMMGASIDGTNLERASLVNAQLQGASLNSARLVAADLSSAGMDGASLSGADLTATSLSLASMRGADFGNAWMFGLVADGARVQDASFEAAQMQGASLQKANFRGTKFQKMAVYGTDVSGSLF